MLLLPCIYGAKAQQSEKDLKKQKRAMPATPLILSASPVHITEENIGIGLSAEIFTDKNGLFSIVLPVSYAFGNSSDYYDPYPYYYGPYYPHSYPWTSEYTYRNSGGMFYFYPGFKIYPTGANKKVSYAAGANLVMAFGTADEITRNYRVDSTNVNGNMQYFNELVSTDTKTIGRFKMGVLVSNSLNLRPSKHLYLGLDLGVGYSYLDNWGNTNEGTGAMVQLGARFGFAK